MWIIGRLLYVGILLTAGSDVVFGPAQLIALASMATLFPVGMEDRPRGRAVVRNIRADPVTLCQHL